MLCRVALRTQMMTQRINSEVEFFRGLKISGKIFSRRYELSRDFRKSILGVFVCEFILLVFAGVPWVPEDIFF